LPAQSPDAAAIHPQASAGTLIPVLHTSNSALGWPFTPLQFNFSSTHTFFSNQNDLVFMPLNTLFSFPENKIVAFFFFKNL
jgi:hypothetical protein